MRIFSKKTFEFDFDGNKVVTQPLGYSEVPDNAEKNRFFALALKAGEIAIFNGPTGSADKNPGNPKPARQRAPKTKEQPAGNAEPETGEEKCAEEQTDKEQP